MSGVLYSAAAFVVAIGVLVTVHEYGHFWVARKLGVKVLRFSIGFGRPLLRWGARDKGTEYVLAMIPLGGYVKMVDEREGEVAAEDLPFAFNRQPLWRRFAIVSAGPVFNFVFAVIAYWLMFVIGVTGLKPIVGAVEADSVAASAGLQPGDVLESVGGRRTPTWETAVFAILDGAMEPAVLELQVSGGRSYRLDLRAAPDILDRGNILNGIGIQPARPSIPSVVGVVEEGGAAQEAGLQRGDRLVAADGVAVDDWADWVTYVRERPGKRISLEVERAGETVYLDLLPRSKDDPEAGEIGYIGASVELGEVSSEAYLAVLQYSPVQAVREALAKTWRVTLLTVRMLGKMLIGEASVENISGPISIAQYAGQSANIGVAQFLAFLAIVSISLGILNLLPIPLLDGGHLMYYCIEFIKGSPVSEKAQLVGQQVGIALLGALMCLAFYNDIVRLIR